jgi:FkbM family methyltransferase
MTQQSANKTKNINISYPDYGNLVLQEGYSVHADWYRRSEQQTKLWWANNIKPNWNIMDIGANIGMYTALFSKLAPEGNIYCFEPTPTMEMLKSNMKHLQATNCHFYEEAVGNKTGTNKDKLQMIWRRKVLEQEFKFVTVDSFVKRNKNLKIDAIKIDVDGYDPEVLYGSVNTLKKQSPVIVVELNREALGYRGHKPRDAVDFMRQHNYELVEVMDKENYLFKKIN